jgi:hypothetical protein
MDAISRILAPVRYTAWLTGELGQELHTQLTNALAVIPQARVTRLARGFLIEADEAPGPLLEAVARAMQDMESGVAAAYPIFHTEMGPVWTGTLQSVFAPDPAPRRAKPVPGPAWKTVPAKPKPAEEAPVAAY